MGLKFGIDWLHYYCELAEWILSCFSILPARVAIAMTSFLKVGFLVVELYQWLHWSVPFQWVPNECLGEGAAIGLFLMEGSGLSSRCFRCWAACWSVKRLGSFIAKCWNVDWLFHFDTNCLSFIWIESPKVASASEINTCITCTDWMAAWVGSEWLSSPLGLSS